jgi:hypothetical protein
VGARVNGEVWRRCGCLVKAASGVKPHRFLDIHAALKRRSSTVLYTDRRTVKCKPSGHLIPVCSSLLIAAELAATILVVWVKHPAAGKRTGLWVGA